MSLKDLKDKDNSNLEHELADKLKHLFELRTQAVTEKLEDPTRLGKTRRDIARIKTLLRQREIATAETNAAAAAKSTVVAEPAKA